MKPFDKDLPVDEYDETLEESLRNAKEWFEGWRGSGSLRNQEKNYLEERWQKFLKVYNLTGNTANDFLAFLQWDNEGWWRQKVNPGHSPEQHAIAGYMMQQNVKIQDAIERIARAAGDLR
jgi:hypothetical protein